MTVGATSVAQTRVPKQAAEAAPTGSVQSSPSLAMHAPDSVTPPRMCSRGHPQSQLATKPQNSTIMGIIRTAFEIGAIPMEDMDLVVLPERIGFDSDNYACYKF